VKATGSLLVQRVLAFNADVTLIKCAVLFKIFSVLSAFHSVLLLTASFAYGWWYFLSGEASPNKQAITAVVSWSKPVLTVSAMEQHTTPQ
jgi:hypothetical protein